MRPGNAPHVIQKMNASPYRSEISAVRRLTHQQSEPLRACLSATLRAFRIATGTRTTRRKTIVPAVILRRMPSPRKDAPSFRQTPQNGLRTGRANGLSGSRLSSIMTQSIIVRRRIPNSYVLVVIIKSGGRSRLRFQTFRFRPAPNPDAISKKRVAPASAER